MLYNGIFGCHGNICYVIIFGKVHRGPVNVCVPILRSIHTKFMNLENMQKIMLYLMSHDAKTVRHQEHFAINQKSLRLPVQKLWLNRWF